MKWKIAEAKQQFSHMMHAAAQEPQLIYNRDRLVGAVINPEDFEGYQSWKERQKTSLWEATRELRKIAAEENYELPILPRSTRPNPFAEERDDAPC